MFTGIITIILYAGQELMIQENYLPKLVFTVCPQNQIRCCIRNA